MLSSRANPEWKRLLAELEQGESVEPQISAGAAGRKSLELLGFTTCIDMTRPVVTNEVRKLNYHFMCAEAHWMLTGDNRVATIEPYCKKIASYSDDGEIFYGAYGPEIEHQIGYVIYKLIADPSSRQAIISIWKRNPTQSKDIPCTLSLQFTIRKNALNIIACMRSSDAWLGWPYDVFNFSMLGAYVVLRLRFLIQYEKLQLGSLHIFAGSQHIYEDCLEKAVAAIKANAATCNAINLDEFSKPDDLIWHLSYMKNKQYDQTTSSFLKDIMV